MAASCQEAYTPTRPASPLHRGRLLPGRSHGQWSRRPRWRSSPGPDRRARREGCCVVVGTPTSTGAAVTARRGPLGHRRTFLKAISHGSTSGSRRDLERRRQAAQRIPLLPQQHQTLLGVGSRGRSASAPPRRHAVSMCSRNSSASSAGSLPVAAATWLIWANRSSPTACRVEGNRRAWRPYAPGCRPPRSARRLRRADRHTATRRSDAQPHPDRLDRYAAPQRRP